MNRLYRLSIELYLKNCLYFFEKVDRSYNELKTADYILSLYALLSSLARCAL